MPSFALLPAAPLSLRQLLRNFRMSVPASTPFIGPGENNFSHKIKARFPSPMSHLESICPGSVHRLSRDATTTVLLHFNRCLIALHRFVPIRFRRVPEAVRGRRSETSNPLRTLTAHSSRTKKSAARGSPLAATGMNNNRSCSLPVNLSTDLLLLLGARAG
jgi:hypothetical protein